MAVSGGKSRVVVTDRFPVVERRVESLAVRMVEAGARAAARVGSGIAAQRRRTGLMETMDVTPAVASFDGVSAGVTSRAWYAGFQSEGTVAARTRAVKPATLSRRSSPSGRARFAKAEGSKGVSPLRFFAAMRAAGRKAMLDEAERGL